MMKYSLKSKNLYTVVLLNKWQNMWCRLLAWTFYGSPAAGSWKRRSMFAYFRLITSGRPRVRRTVVVDVLEWHSQALILLFWALLEVKAGFGWSQLNFLGSDRRVQWKQQKCSLLSQTHSRCGNKPKLFGFVTMIFAVFQTMSMVSLNKIGTRVLEHEPKAWVAFFIGHPVLCHIALAVWSYWHGCRERIFLNISNASNPMETP